MTEQDNLNILVIDINPQMRKLWEETLSSMDYNVKSAAKVDDGLKLAKQGIFQIIIVDLTSKERSGSEELQKFREIAPKVCLIASCARPSLESVIQAMREGAYDYIRLPFDIEEVKSVLRRVKERYYLFKEADQKEYYRELSILDGLTGLYNYRYFHEALGREVVRAKRYPQAFSLLMIDIDDFKNYNDVHGHLAGDELLRLIGKLFTESIRFVDMVFRYGGEEFAILMPQTAREGAAAAANRVIKLIQQKMPVTISAGLSSFPEDGLSKDALIEHADKALYQAKAAGKVRICVFGEKLYGKN